MVKNLAPKRGDVIFMSFDPSMGHEQAGRRPAVVLSWGEFNQETGFCIVCPVTSKVKGYPFEVVCTIDNKRAAILVNHMRSVDWKVRGISSYTTVPEGAMVEVEKKIVRIIF